MSGGAPRVRIAAGVCAAAAAFVLVAMPGTGVAHADTVTQPLPVDGQDYAPVSPFPDAYNGDPLAVHVGVTGGQPSYYAYIHVALDGLPPQASDEHLTFSFTPDTTNAYNNVNTSAAILSMCVLAQQYPATWNSSSPPRYDCTRGSSVGTQKGDGTWSFDATKLLAAWRSGGDTGAVIIPEYQPTDSWEVSFTKSLTEATYSAVTPAPQSTVIAPPTIAPVPSAPAVVAPDHAPAPLPTARPLPSASPTAAATPAPARSSHPAAGAGTAQDTSGGDGGASGRWIAALALSALAALLLVGRPLSRAASGLAGPFRPVFLAEMRTHPRAFTMASVLLGWSVAFSGYSLATGPLNPASSHGALASNSGSGDSGGGAGGDGSTTSGGSTTGGSPGAPGSVGPNLAAAGSGSNSGGGGGGNGGGPTATPFNGYGVNLWGPDRDRIGIDGSTIKLCGHSALIFGPAFNVQASDLNVFWDYVNDHGGAAGRKVTLEWNDDSYQPANAVQAAQKCEDDGAFIVLSGIGFDQIPAVRVWAEQHQELYLYHVAVQHGSEAFRYSYTEFPSVEQLGQQAADLTIQKYRGHKVAIIERQSSNWEPGTTVYKQALAAAGIQITDDEYVSNNQGTYTQNLVKMQQSGADTVLVWENALADTEIIEQAHGQHWFPHMVMFPFNLTIEKLQQSDLKVPFDGVAAWLAYTHGDYGNAQQFDYAAEVQRFEAAYAQYDPQADLNGFGGDLLWGTWLDFMQVNDLLQRCGGDCTRNKLAAELQGYHVKVGVNCDVDLTGDRHHGGLDTDTFVGEVNNGRNEWLMSTMCQRP